MAATDDKSPDSLEKQINQMLRELEKEIDLSRHQRAKRVSDTMNAAFEIKSTVMKLDTYTNLKHAKTYGIVIPESSLDNLLKMLKNLFEGENK